MLHGLGTVETAALEKQPAITGRRVETMAEVASGNGRYVFGRIQARY